MQDEEEDRVAEYFAVVGSHNVTPVPQGCIGLDENFIDIPDVPIRDKEHSFHHIESEGEGVDSGDNDNNDDGNDANNHSQDRFSDTESETFPGGDSPKDVSNMFPPSPPSSPRSSTSSRSSSSSPQDHGHDHDHDQDHDQDHDHDHDHDHVHDQNLPPYCSVSLRNTWRSAIVDIGILFPEKNEPLPPGFVVLSPQTPLNSGLSSSLQSLLCVKRRGGDNRPDHIIDIKLVTSRSAVPPGFECVRKTVR